MSEIEPIGRSTDAVAAVNSDEEGAQDSYVAEYDESSYPANADSESEEEQLIIGDAQCVSSSTASTVCSNSSSDVLESKGWRESGVQIQDSALPLSEDVSCAVCAEIFVEPCTLHCGHSFCQLCLAALWKSSRNKSPLQLHCPVCRQPWVNFPGVNIQLRNIIEKSHGQLVDYRRSHFCESDKTTLVNFKRAIDGDWKKERQQTRQQQQLRPVIWFILLAIVLMCGMMIIIAVVLFSALTFSGDNEYVQKAVAEWSNDDVMAWLGGLGDWASHNISRIFSKEKITGAQLKLIDLSALKNLGIHGDNFQTQSLLLAIQQLKQKEYVHPRNFNEFMAAHRKNTVLIGIMYKLWPRFTFFYIYLFEYRDVFLPVWQYSAAVHQTEAAESPLQPTRQQMMVFGVEVLLVPHYVVGLFAWQWFSLHPWLCTAIIIHCVWATQSEAKKIIAYILAVTLNNWKLKSSQTLRIVMKNIVKFVAVLSGGLVMWPIVPHFLCDGLFYLVVWNTVYTHLLVMPWKLFTARRQRQRARVVRPLARAVGPLAAHHLHLPHAQQGALP